MAETEQDCTYCDGTGMRQDPELDDAEFECPFCDDGTVR